MAIPEPSENAAEAPQFPPPEGPAIELSHGDVTVDESTRESVRLTLLEFGDRAALRPEPNEVVDQSARAEDYVADVELDGARLGAVEVRAISVRGHAHRWLGEVRQDAMALGRDGSVLLVAAADGVGNSTESHIGSNAAVREAVRPAVDPSSVVIRARQVVHDSSVTRGLEPRDVSTTLLVAQVDSEPSGNPESPPSYSVTLWQVGDSVFARVRDGQWDVLAPSLVPDAGSVLTNSAVDALPTTDAVETWQETFVAGDVLVLASDGVANPVLANSGYRQAVLDLFDGGVPSFVELLRVVDATVKSFDDDRTLVAVCFGTPG